MDTNDPNAGTEAVELKPRSASSETTSTSGTGTTPVATSQSAKKPATPERRSYRPSGKATFIGLGIVLLLLGVGAAVIVVIVKKQTAANSSTPKTATVTIDSAQLSQLGINHQNIGQSQEALVVSPNARFDGQVAVAKDVTLSGKLQAGQTSLTGLQAGDTSLTTLNVNGTSNLTAAVLRSDLTVSGTTHLQGAATIDKLLTLNQGLNVSGDLTVGGTFTSNNFNARSLTAISTLTIGGHIITSGSAPTINAGPGVGPSGTVSISGSDSAGTIAINTGQSPSPGVLASINFHTTYGSVPRVIISPVGQPTGALGYYTDRSATGFSIGSATTPATGSGYVFDYLVVQ